MSDIDGSSDRDAPTLTESENEMSDSCSDEESQDADSDEESPPPPLSADKDEDKTEQLRAEGNDYFKKKLYTKAIAKYTDALQANPEDKNNAAKCYRNMSICYSKKEDFGQAVDQAILSIQAQPNCSRAYHRCGLAYMEMGKHTVAGVVFLKGLEIGPKSDEIKKEWQTLCQDHKDEVRHAEDYFKNNKISDIRKIEIEIKSETKKRKQRKEKEMAIPDLVESSGESDPSDISNVTIESEEGAKPAKMRNLTEKKTTGVDVSLPPLASDSDSSDSDSDSSDSMPGEASPSPASTPTSSTSATSVAVLPPKFIPGKLARCKWCGYLSLDFNKCVQCKRILPEDCKAIDDTALKPKPDSTHNEMAKKEEHKKKIMKDKVLADQKKLNEKKREEEIKEATRKMELEAKKKEIEQKKREEREQEIFRKREEEKLLQEQKQSDPKQEIKAQFKKICNEASTCLINTVPSMEGFSKALEMVDKESKALWTTKQYKDLAHNEEVVVIKYMFARACGQTNNYDCILAGLKKLDEIRDNHKHVKFPTVFYGLSSLWIKLNRFDKATAAVEDGIDFLERGFNVTPYNWPGIPSKLVEETRKDILLEKLRILAADLKYPPRPDAVCRWNSCIQIQSHIVPSENIYISDPDYKGYFKVSCRMDCQVCYHKACWIAVKGENIEKLKLTKVPTEKDFLGQSCFTPDCDAVIVKIEIFEDNLGKMTTIQDAKLIEKLEDDERKHKEEARNKKEREEHEKRVKMFEKKQMKENHEKQSNKQKEKAEENIAVEKQPIKKKGKHNGKNDLHGEEFSKGNSNINMQNWSKGEKKKKGAKGNHEKDKSVIPELTCCYPDGCFQKNNVLNLDDLSDTQKVTCSNSKCDQSGYMHLACFFKFESMVVGFLGKQPRGRMWTQQQCLINVWNKKGYEVVFKMCGCLCGHGKIRKDIDWTAPKAKAVVKEGANAAVAEKRKTEENVKLETAKESSISQNYYFGEKNKQRDLSKADLIPVIKEKITDVSNESIKLDERSKVGKVENPTGSIKESILNVSNSTSIITLEDSEDLEETCSPDLTTASTESSGVSEKSFESSHVRAYKPSLGEIAQQMKEKIVGKLSKESQLDAASKQMIPEQISCNFQPDINTKRSKLVNNNVRSVACEENDNHDANNAVSTSAQTDLVLMNFGDVDPGALQQQNENLILELQEMKDKFYKIQSERKMVEKEYNDKCASMAEDNKSIRIENDSFKEKMNKMKKSINDTAKISDELRKTSDSLKSTRSQLEETKKCLKEEQSHSLQINSQLTLVSEEKELESQLNNLLRAKLLQNDLRKYREILRLKQENNRSVINLLRGSRELDNIPQIQLALSSLNEYSARLLLADEELNNQYATLVRQSEENKTVQELYFDLSSVEPPNLGPSCLNLLHNFVILSQSSSHPAASPFSFPPAPISRSSTSTPLLPDLSTVTGRGDARGPHVAKTIFSNPPPGYATISTFPGSQVGGPSNSCESASVSQDSFQTASASASPFSLSPPSSPSSRSEVAKSGVIVANPSSASKVGASGTSINVTRSGPVASNNTNGATATYSASNGVTASYPTSAGATASYPTSAGATASYPTSTGATASYPTSAGATASYPTSAGATASYPTSAGATPSYLTSAGATASYPTSAGATASYPTSAGATPSYPTTTGATAFYPTSVGATSSYPISAGASAVKSNCNGATATNTTSNGSTATSTGATTTYRNSSGAAAATSQPASSTNPNGAKPRVGPNVDGATAKTGKKYDKLIGLLQKNHPNLSPSQALDYVMKLRKSNNGKLTGMSIQDILDRVASFIHRDQDGDCSICFEDMDSGESLYLNPCRHRFHKECINQWLESPGGAGSTCPMCRIYIVKEEEFPNLGAARRF